VGPNYQVSSKLVNRKWVWVNGRRQTNKQTDRQTDKQTDTLTDNKGRFELSGVREPTDRQTDRQTDKSYGTMRHVRSGKNTRWK